jgi:hypothetical protein
MSRDKARRQRLRILLRRLNHLRKARTLDLNMIQSVQENPDQLLLTSRRN